ncbi:MAG: hypothetical protein ACYCZZ_00255 [Minisyncoccota bacterium]
MNKRHENHLGFHAVLFLYFPIRASGLQNRTVAEAFMLGLLAFAKRAVAAALCQKMNAGA